MNIASKFVFVILRLSDISSLHIVYYIPYHTFLHAIIPVILLGQLYYNYLISSFILTVCYSEL